jgi:hypothetical protein
MTASVIGPITGLVLTVAAAGAVYDAAHAGADLDHSTSIQAPALSAGTGGPSGGTVYMSQLGATTGEEIRVAPKDVRGHAQSFLSPRREPKTHLPT